MSKGARASKGAMATVGVAVLALTACGSGEGLDGEEDTGAPDANGEITIEFSQWWEPELPDGTFRELMDRFEEENPGIKVELLSGPYTSTRDQVVAGAASGTMADIVGLDGAWVYDFVQQGAIADLSAIMRDAGYDESQLASQIALDGSTYMIPVVNFVYPLFTNDAVLEEAGVDAPPTNRSEFLAAAEAITASEGNVSGWVLPLSLETPNGIQNDVMSWAWASGGSMLDDQGQPDLTNDDVRSAVEFVKELWDAGVVAPGALTMQEQDKVEEFTNGRVGMMISSLAHITLIGEQNPDLAFSISAIPAEDSYQGERGIPYASWGIGIAENSSHKEEAWALIEFLMNEQENGELATLANGFPGNTTAVPDFAGDELLEQAFEIYQAGYPENEFVGLPVAEELMRSFSVELQRTLEEDQPVDVTLETAQEAWMEQF